MLHVNATFTSSTHKKYLKHKKPKEKANFLNGLARDVGKNPGIYGISTTIILMAIYVAFFQYNLGGYITSSTRDIWNGVFSSINPEENKNHATNSNEDQTPHQLVAQVADVSAKVAAAAANYIAAADKDVVEKVTLSVKKKEYEELAKMIKDNEKIGAILYFKMYMGNADSEEADVALKELLKKKDIEDILKSSRSIVAAEIKRETEETEK